MYYAVIFTSTRTEIEEGYAETAIKMLELAKVQPGFMGVESARNEIGITVSYWESLEAIQKWKTNIENGRTTWYKNYKVRIAKVEREYEF
jgi:heme-degrading monooxygenase HmoA